MSFQFVASGARLNSKQKTRQLKDPTTKRPKKESLIDSSSWAGDSGPTELAAADASHRRAHPKSAGFRRESTRTRYDDHRSTMTENQVVRRRGPIVRSYVML